MTRGQTTNDDKAAASRAVLFAAHPWKGTPYGLHHIARALASLGWEVLYLEQAFSPLHLIAGRRRGRMVGRAPRASGEGRISLLSPFVPLPHLNLPLLRSAATLHAAALWSWPRLPQALTQTSFARPDLVVSGSPEAWHWALSLDARVTAYRLADDLQLFDSVTPAIRSLEAEMLSRYHVILATSDSLVERARFGGAKRVHLLPNGVDIATFAKPQPEPLDLDAIARPRILYVGAVDEWFDWDAVSFAARERPNYAFLIVGPIALPSSSAVPDNVFLLGPRPYEQIPSYMQAATVGIIPFATPGLEKEVRSINPIKLYEYLAAGLPVVSSVKPPQIETEALTFYRTHEEFVIRLDQAIGAAETVRVAAPPHSDWRHVVREMLDEFGLP